MKVDQKADTTVDDTRIIPLYPSNSPAIPFPFIRHPHCNSLFQLLENWRCRFPHLFDEEVYNKVAIFFNFSSRASLDRHTPLHLFRLLMRINHFHNLLLHNFSLNPHIRHILIKFLPTHLIFPFSSKAVLGCLIGLTLRNHQEGLTTEDLQYLIDKNCPDYQLVPGMIYYHPMPHDSIRLIYFEIEKKSGGFFTIPEQGIIYKAFIKRLQEDLPRFVRSVFVPRNQEEVYKNILLLSQEIKSTEDLPHVMISLDQQKNEELVFLITLVYASSRKPISLDSLFARASPTIKFISESYYPVTFLENRQPVMAYLFRLHITQQSRMAADSALHFYEARRQISDLLQRILGEFRDYNGGLILKLDEQLSRLKEHFANTLEKDPAIIDTFFYSLTPLEKQATLDFPTLCHMLSHFLKAQDFRPSHLSQYYFVTEIQENKVFATILLPASSFQQTVRVSFEELILNTTLHITWSILEIRGSLSIILLIESSLETEVETYLEALRNILERWAQQVAGQRVSRIALLRHAPSLDPRLGSDEQSSNLLRMLFEGLTRFNHKGKIEEGIAESILVLNEGYTYIFKLRQSTWNDGALLTAHDFAYAWKKILSPHFSISFAYFFYPIKNAQAIKEGRISMEHLGIQVIDDYTFKVILEYPAPYFLELISHPLFSPIHRIIDQKSPYWTTNVGASYPCNGPFQLMTSHPNYGYQLIKNPLYWDASNAPLDQMIFLCVNPYEAQQLFQRGEIDWLGDPFVGIDLLSSENNLKGEMYQLTGKSTLWCLLNTQKFPFQHYKFRQALGLATDSMSLFRSIYPLAEFNSSPLPLHLSQSNSSALGYDLTRARVIFEEFLEDLQLSKEKFPPLTILHSTRKMHKDIALVLADHWTQTFGISCKAEEEPWGSLYQKYKTGDFNIGILRWISRFNDPAYTLNAFRYSSKVVNFPKWEDPLYQYFMTKADETKDPFKRKIWLKKAEHHLQTELPIIPLFHVPYQCLKRQGVDPTFLTRCGFLIDQKPLRGAKNE